MILPSMTFDEITKQLYADIAMVERKAGYHAPKWLKAQRNKKIPCVEAFEYLHPKSKNKWIYFFQSAKDSVFVTFVNYHNTSIGIRAAMIGNEKQIVLYNGHLFSRFAERENLDIPNPLNKIKAFFKKNPTVVLDKVETGENRWGDRFGKVNTGVVLCQSVNPMLVICKTYLSNQMQKGQQPIYAIEQQEVLDNYISNRILKS